MEEMGFASVQIISVLFNFFKCHTDIITSWYFIAFFSNDHLIYSRTNPKDIITS